MTRPLPVLLTLLLSSEALAVEPSRTPVAEALRRGEVAFIGRVVSAREIHASGASVSEVEVTIAVSHCLRGASCAASRVRVRYWASSDRGSVVPASFEVGARYLWVFRRATRGPILSFDTTWADGWTDMAYVIRGGVGVLPEAERHELRDIWSAGASESVSVRELHAWASERQDRGRAATPAARTPRTAP